MDELLRHICKKYGIDERIVYELIQIEKNSVHKKRRHIFGDLKQLIENEIEREVINNDYDKN